ncbi:MAG: secretin N-terminal domain-containing protein [Pirellulales bacterium]
MTEPAYLQGLKTFVLGNPKRVWGGLAMGGLAVILSAGLWAQDLSPANGKAKSATKPDTATVAAAPGAGTETASPKSVPSDKVPATDPAARTVLKAYPNPDGDAAQVATQLQAEFSAQPGVRIAADPRTGQILALAPPEIQTLIADRLASLTPEVKKPASPKPAEPPTAVRATVRRIQLKRAAWLRIEDALRETWNGQLSAGADTGGGVSTYVLDLGGRGKLELYANARTGEVTVQGAPAAAEACVQLIQSLDVAAPTADQRTRVVPLRNAESGRVRWALEAFRSGNEPAGPEAGRGGLATMLFQPKSKEEAEGPATTTGQPPRTPGEAAPKTPATTGAPGGIQAGGGLVGPVQIEFLEGLDVVVVRGNQRDVERVMKIIEDIEQLSVETQPQIEVHHLKNVQSEAMATLVTPLYEQVLLPRQGRVSITALVKPNALLLIGRQDSVKTVIDLVDRLDQPVSPATQFKVFQLQHTAAATAQTTIEEFFAERTGLGTKALATADFRTNSLIVQASPRDMAEVELLIKRIDVATSAAVDELRVYKLQNSLAENLAPILQDAVNAQGGTTARRTGVGGAGGGAGGAAGAAAQQGASQKSSMLRFVTVDAQGRHKLNSGILTDVRITADPRANTILVAAPADSLELIEALIKELDQMPATVAQIKVFTIVNGDAESLLTMLDNLFGQQQQGVTGMEPSLQTAAGPGESSLVALRFSVDRRTNSIIASGSAGDLSVVEAILLRLDASDMRERKSTVYRLKNAPSDDVAYAITNMLTNERRVEQLTPGLISPFEQIEREVVVVSEPVSNSLIVSATPRYFEEVKKLVEDLDSRPPMVVIQVLMGEVSMGNADEFGIEMGLQDGLLFDRSLLGDLVTTSTTTLTPAGTVASTTVVGASNTPGFNFNNTLPLGNSGSDQSLARSNRVGTQGLSNFAVGRLNNELGFGGLMLSASSENISLLVRALQQCQRLEVLSRPQITTLDNQSAYIRVGERVPRIDSSSTDTSGRVFNSVTMEDVGIILGVTPRISPDNLVVMEINVEKSEVGPESEGIPVAISNTNEAIRSPRIKATTAQTTVAALNGQTVMLSGLITKNDSQIHRRVPLLSSIPVLGNLFRYDYVNTKRTELLIIMTPHIVRTSQDVERVKQAEAARMTWCLADVESLHGPTGMRRRADDWSDSETTVVYPDFNPHGDATATPNGMGPTANATLGPEGQPTPQPQPVPMPESVPMSQPQPMPAPPQDPALPQPQASAAPAPSRPQGNELRLQPATGDAPAGYAAPASQGPAVKPASYQQPMSAAQADPRNVRR